MSDPVKEEFEKILTGEILGASVRSGTELVIPLNEAKQAVVIARENLIAILGVEVFRILDDGFGVETYSGYSFEFEGNWKDFVILNNDAALHFMDENRFGDGYGHILTAASEAEFSRLG
jgi:hypothetical protein